VVFSSLNHALADSLDPALGLGHQIGCGSLAADVERITAAVADPATWLPDPQALERLLATGSEPALRDRWRQALVAINAHWDRLLAGERPLRAPAPLALRAAQWRQRAERLLARGR
jgi:hypothetical protein